METKTLVRHFVVSVALAASAFACASEDAAPAPSSAEDRDRDKNASDPSRAPNGNDNGNGNGNVSDAGRDPDDKGHGETSNDLFPLVNGRKFHYTIARGSRTGCADGTMTITITGPENDASGAYFTRTMSCGVYPTMDVKKDTSELWSRVGGTSDWYRFMSLPPSDGKEFVAGGVSGASFTWSSVPTITVPAGTYTQCWRRKQNGYEMSEIYCPGVGMVSADYHEWGQDEGYDLTGIDL